MEYKIQTIKRQKKSGKKNKGKKKDTRQRENKRWLKKVELSH